MQPPLIFDLDNTLLRCSVYYQQAKDRFKRLMQEQLDVSPENASQAYLTIHQQKVEAAGGEEWRWFPESLPEAYKLLAQQTGQEIKQTLLDQTRQLGMIVPQAPYEPYEGALETVEHYREAGFRLGLYTKGAPPLQSKKIQRYGLDQLFDIIRIVPRKDPDEIQQLARNLGVNGHPGLMIGDSRRDDVRCGRQAGLQTVLVQEACEVANMDYHQRYEAGHEVEPDFQIEGVRQLPQVVAPDRKTTRSVVR